MKKEFLAWHVDKALVDTRKSIHAKVGQIRHCKRGINIGSETDGKGGFLRPVLVLGILGNMAFVVPLTTTAKSLPFYHQLNLGILDTSSYAILSQARSIDTRRLIKQKYTLSKDDLLITKKLFIQLLG